MHITSKTAMHITTYRQAVGLCCGVPSDDERKQDSGSKSEKQKKAKAKAAGGKPSTTEHLLDLSKSFDKGMPKPKSRAEEKKQKAEQLANLLRIQKELTSDYKVAPQSCCNRAR